MLNIRSRSIWHLVGSVATAISQSYGIARSRALTNPMASVRMKAQRDLLYTAGTLNERRRMIERYANKIKADPNEQIVHIGLYPTLLSQRIAGAGFEPTTSGL